MGVVGGPMKHGLWDDAWRLRDDVGGMHSLSEP